MVVRVMVYDGKGNAMGEIQVGLEALQAWMATHPDPAPDTLAGVRDLVDPEHENATYDWDLWARPAEVARDIRGL
jgi:hypothetical protein